MFSFKSLKVQLNLFLIVFAVFVCLQSAKPVFLLGPALSILFAVLTEAAFLFPKDKKFHITASAITSGLILGLVLSPESSWGMYLAAAVATIGLKHIVKYRGKNLFNPAALGIFVTLLPLQGNTAWQGTYLWYLLVPAGAYFAVKIRKAGVLLGYFAMSLLLFIPQALSQGTPLGNIPGYFSYFFIFIMMIEPKTTPATKTAKVLFGAGVALLVFLLTEWGFPYEPELSALLLLNACVPLLNKIPDPKFSTSSKTPERNSP